MKGIPKADRDKFVSAVNGIVAANQPDFTKSLGYSTVYDFIGDNSLFVSIPSAESMEYTLTVFARFDKLEPALDMNPHSFKYNFHCDHPVDTAIEHFEDWFEQALKYVGRKTTEI